MSRLPQHEKLASLAEDVVAQLMEEGRLGTAAASLARMQITVLTGLMRVDDLEPAGLIALVDSTDAVLDFLARHSPALYPSQRLLFEKLKRDLTGVPSPRRAQRSRGDFISRLNWDSDSERTTTDFIDPTSGELSA